MTSLENPFEDSKAGPEVNQVQAWHHRLNTPELPNATKVARRPLRLQIVFG